MFATSDSIRCLKGFYQIQSYFDRFWLISTIFWQILTRFWPYFDRFNHILVESLGFVLKREKWFARFQFQFCLTSCNIEYIWAILRPLRMLRKYYIPFIMWSRKFLSNSLVLLNGAPSSLPQKINSIVEFHFLQWHFPRGNFVFPSFFYSTLNPIIMSSSCPIAKLRFRWALWPLLGPKQMWLSPFFSNGLCHVNGKKNGFAISDS